MASWRNPSPPGAAQAREILGEQTGGLPAWATIDDEIRQATRERAAEGARLMAELFTSRLAIAGLVIAYHVVLTFDDRRYDRGRDLDPASCAGLWRWLVRQVNLDVANGRRDCKHRFGHSFFAYLAGYDRGRALQRSHWHAIISDAPRYSIKDKWSRFGNAHIRPVAGDGSAAALAYVCGEACKYGAPDVWIPRRVRDWREEIARSGARSSVAPEATSGEAPDWAPEWWMDL